MRFTSAGMGLLNYTIVTVSNFEVGNPLRCLDHSHHQNFRGLAAVVPIVFTRIHQWGTFPYLDNVP